MSKFNVEFQRVSRIVLEVEAPTNVDAQVTAFGYIKAVDAGVLSASALELSETVKVNANSEGEYSFVNFSEIHSAVALTDEELDAQEAAEFPFPPLDPTIPGDPLAGN